MADETTGDYGLTLPDDDTLSARFRYLVNYWKNRNAFVNDVRRALNGMNKIEVPVSTQYQAKALHCYMLAALVQEKTSRYLPMFNVQVIPEGDGVDPEARAKATRIEQAINVGNYEIERRADGDVWSRVVQDAVLLDEGVEILLDAPNPFWTELVTYEESAKMVKEYKADPSRFADRPPPVLEYEFLGESDLRAEYKKQKGIPITRRYVPLEDFYPQYDGSTLIEAFWVDERSLLSIRNNPLFANDPKGVETLKRLPAASPSGGIDQLLNVVTYVNNDWICYYLGNPVNNNSNRWPKVRGDLGQFAGGKLSYLYGYRHNIGRSLFNCVGGRFGGWKTSSNRIEGVGKGLLELSQALDEILSQVFTNTGAKYWPNLNFELDPEQRGYGPGGTHPDAPKVKPGEPIVTFVGEKIHGIFEATEDPMTMWLWDQIQSSISKMGGSSILFGEKSPGVDTGYHQALQKTAAENLDEKIEQHASQGAVQDCTIWMLLAKKLNEELFMHYTETDANDKTRKLGKYISLKPEDLTPLPRIDAQVRKPSPVDYIAALTAFEKATDDRQGKGPALSDDTARVEILGIEAPDVEKFKTLVEASQREMLKSGALNNKIMEMANMKLATAGAPTPSPEMLAKADPALLAAISSGNAPGGPATQMGGTSPALLGAAAQVQPPTPQPPGAGQPPGPTVGSPEIENRLGEAVQNSMSTGAGAFG